MEFGKEEGLGISMGRAGTGRPFTLSYAGFKESSFVSGSPSECARMCVCCVRWGRRQRKERGRGR